MTLIGAILAAAWLGLPTSVSPCPLATNIAAVSLLARRLDSNRRATLGVLSYAAGRATAYAAIGLLLGWGVAAAPTTSRILQSALEPFTGPLLIVVGLVLLGWIPLNLNFGPAKPGATDGLANRGLPGAFLLGPLFVIYGLATALPVAVVALVVPFGVQAGAALVGGLQRWQGALQTANGWLLVAIGIYLTLSGTLDVI